MNVIQKTRDLDQIFQNRLEKRYFFLLLKITFLFFKEFYSGVQHVWHGHTYKSKELWPRMLKKYLRQLEIALTPCLHKRFLHRDGNAKVTYVRTTYNAAGVKKWAKIWGKKCNFCRETALSNINSFFRFFLKVAFYSYSLQTFTTILFSQFSSSEFSLILQGTFTQDI